MKTATKFKCVCGYVHDGDEAPAKCPKCGAPAERFTKLEDAAAALVEQSRRSNSYHCQLVALAREIEVLCKAGIEDKLDPGCVDVFTKSLAASYDMMKLSMTEMAGHAAKGKWG